jgi:hypothetical protein
MAKGDRPSMRLKAKPKDGKSRITLFSIWRGERGNTAKLDREVAEVRMKDGTVFNDTNAYFDLFEEDGGGGQRPAPRDTGGNGGAGTPTPGDDDIPFIRCEEV